MKDLIQEYKGTLSSIIQAIHQTQSLQQTVINQDQLKLLRSMANDVRWTIQLMEKGREPIPSSPFSKLPKEKREVILDPQSVEQRNYTPAFQQSESNLSTSDRFRLDRLLQILTPREREIYELNRGKCFTQKEIATILQITPSTVQQSLIRIEQKIRKKIKLMKSLECQRKQPFANRNK